MFSRSIDPIRALSVSDLDLELPEAKAFMVVPETTGSLDSADIELPVISADHPLLTLSLELLKDGYAGILFSGPPGTGKTWSARQIALTIVSGHLSRLTSVQFHPSYQYEDFIVGYVPTDDSYQSEMKSFAKSCIAASADPGNSYVVVVDEFSRVDAARVFGEALTYIETSKRDIEFTLSSGDTLSIPKNLVLLGTMNPWDRGVEDLDVAFERRFATIELRPDTSRLRAMLAEKIAPKLLDGVVTFFEGVQKIKVEALHIGQAYFSSVRDEESLRRLWAYQLRPQFVRACRGQLPVLDQVDKLWVDSVGQAFAAKSGTAAMVEIDTVAPGAE